MISAENTLLCMFQRLCTYFQDTGVLIFGGMYFRGIAADSKFQEKMKGYLFSEGYLFTGLYGISNLSFLGSSRNSKLFITSQWI